MSTINAFSVVVCFADLFFTHELFVVFNGSWQSAEEKTKSESAEVTLNYIGSGISLNLYVIDPTDDVIIEQQHCGGNTVVVYRGRVLPGSQFTALLSHFLLSVIWHIAETYQKV